ncbi:MAG TPA: TfoX/Sxy family protein [Alphaproteobacteria bacterium]|nr:TfoX/Sxy family protein [Alphaproteobacteria bacterium]
MGRRNEFVEHVVDRLTPLGPASARAMFGAWGIYLDGMMIALVSDGALYLKADDSTRREFEAQGSRPFKPFADKPTILPYYELPAEAHDDPDIFLGWFRCAADAAARTRPPKGAGRRVAPKIGTVSPSTARRPGQAT